MSITVRRTRQTSVWLSSFLSGSHTLEELLLQLGLGDLNLNGLVNLLRVTAFVIGVVLNGGGKEGVDECSLAESRLASNL